MAIQYKTPAQMRTMARAGVVVEAALAAAREAAVIGATTADVDAAAARVIASAGATSNFLGYHGFPATTCVSVNDEVVHGIPGARVLHDGDVVSIDCGAIVDGWHGDSAITVVLGDHPDPADVALSDATRTALWAGIAALATARRLDEVGAAIEDVATAAGLHPVDGYVGHGIGTEMHQEPDVMNYRVRGRLAKVRPACASRSSRCSCAAPPSLTYSTMTGPWFLPTARARLTGSTRSPFTTAAFGCLRPPTAG